MQPRMMRETCRPLSPSRSVSMLRRYSGLNGLMQPSNRPQYDDALADRVPAPDEVRDGVWSIPLPMAQPGNPFSLCYAVADSAGSLHLIDSGYDTDENWELLTAALAGFGQSVDDVASLTVSHLH